MCGERLSMTINLLGQYASKSTVYSCGLPNCVRPWNCEISPPTILIMFLGNCLVAAWHGFSNTGVYYLAGVRSLDKPLDPLEDYRLG